MIVSGRHCSKKPMTFLRDTDQWLLKLIWSNQTLQEAETIPGKRDERFLFPQPCKSLILVKTKVHSKQAQVPRIRLLDINSTEENTNDGKPALGPEGSHLEHISRTLLNSTYTSSLCRRLRIYLQRRKRKKSINVRQFGVTLSL